MVLVSVFRSARATPCCIVIHAMALVTIVRIAQCAHCIRFVGGRAAARNCRSRGARSTVATFRNSHNNSSSKVVDSSEFQRCTVRRILVCCVLVAV